MMRDTNLRVVRPLAVSLAIGLSIAGVLGNWTGLAFGDMQDYWDAAIRIQSGQPLYQPGQHGAVSEYRYAPWFAYVWVLLTQLPLSTVQIGWGITVFAATAAVTIHLARQGWAGLALAGLMGVQLLWSARGGNVQPLMVAALYFGLHSRWGPAIVASAATLKVFPIAFVLVYAGRREWGRFYWSLGLTAVLGSTLLLHDLSNYGSSAGALGTNFSLMGLSPVLWALLALPTTMLACWLAFRRSLLTPIAAAVAALTATPRLYLYDATLLLGAANPPARTQRPGSDARSRKTVRENGDKS
jgi:hypothetical protein